MGFSVTEYEKYIFVDFNFTLQLTFKKLPLEGFWNNIKEYS